MSSSGQNRGQKGAARLEEAEFESGKGEIKMSTRTMTFLNGRFCKVVQLEISLCEWQSHYRRAA